MEGIFVLTLPEILEYLDFRAYVETPDDLRMNWRFVREVNEKLRLRVKNNPGLVRPWNAYAYEHGRSWS
ncbi:hypothetical protein [Acaryochloris sp. CCMEE 5410]|uniref:hypothetical protein n=1 Tax=Acaryochloris sp. CCMEE 5410 TaxID=310037 RepID=UPI0008FFD9F2|nr:hypothetical protein [Acaryochloris sp. CCMEE 5410]